MIVTMRRLRQEREVAPKSLLRTRSTFSKSLSHWWRIIDEWHSHRRDRACIHFKGGHLWHLNWLQIMHTQNFSLLILWILEVNRHYCVKYVRVLQFFIFCLLHGSVATRLRCGGKYDKGFVANFMLKPTMKEFWKSANICQSYERM